MAEQLTEIDFEIYGHENVKAVLNAALRSGHIGHAYIFSGIGGVGKYTAALAFARKLIGTQNNEHPDIITVTNELYGIESKSGALLNGTVKELRRDIYIKPYSADRKIYIVPHADTMNTAAQNSLLKVFEEPPLYCTIILIAENSNRFLPTVLSRAAEVRFSPLPARLVADYLREVRGLSAEEAASKAVMSGGSIGTALELSESDGPDEIRRQTIEFVMNLTRSENRVIFDLAKFIKSEKDNIGFIFSVLKSFFDDLVHIKLGAQGEPLNADKTAELKQLSAAVTKRAAVQFLDLTLKYEEILTGSRAVVSNTDFRIAVFCMACEYWEEIHGRDYRSSL